MPYFDRYEKPSEEMIAQWAAEVRQRREATETRQRFGGQDDYSASDGPSDAILEQWRIAAEHSRRQRELRLMRGWHPDMGARGWVDPSKRLRDLEDQYADPEEARELDAARRARERDAEGFRRRDEALAWIRSHDPEIIHAWEDGR
jgi:hypothetical protein